MIMLLWYPALGRHIESNIAVMVFGIVAEDIFFLNDSLASHKNTERRLERSFLCRRNELVIF